ncbi:PTS N-acetylmuramic acid transporter subunit IIBC [Psychromonas sp. CD1]|uniref:PTS N-acetylmuramic acid transporter subunit IIBC n=1 Tax=Psychromonas sp. CD1 TaxID=1979839 RepID=UPI000B9B08E9|nr:PTS N-acetylmuramic acid transporter subunit IIBC [Psychromonas sp. CD1]
MAKITLDMIDKITKTIGNINNIAKCTNCMTRLRLTIIDENVVNVEALKLIAGVLGVVESDCQLQIILGVGKAQQAAELINEKIYVNNSCDNHNYHQSQESLSDITLQKKNNIKKKQSSSAQRFLSKFSTIFTPLIPGFIAAGLLLGFATLFEQIWVVGNTLPNTQLVELLQYMRVFGTGLFAFLSILIGYNAQQAFGGSGVNGAILASLFVMNYNPDTVLGVYSGMSDFFGYAIDPRGNIIGVLIAAIVGAWVERKVRKFVPDSLDMILTSLITLLIMGVLVFLVIMPIGGLLFSSMSWLFLHLNGNPIGSAILAGLFLVAVMFGIHQGFVPVYFALMEAQGFNSLFPILAMAGGGLVGASVALFFKAKKGSTTRAQIKGAIVPGIFGIGEPLIYGVTLPRVKPFITACVGGASGGFFIGLVSYMGLPIGLNTVFGPSGVVAIPLMTSNHGIFVAMGVFVIGLLISYVAGFLATWFFGTKGVDLS